MHFLANRGVRLDDPGWQGHLIEECTRISPRLIILDPLVRMKGTGRDENRVDEIGHVLDYIRALRDATGSAVLVVHHTGHERQRLRGSSDLEAVWESKLVLADGRTPDGHARPVDVLGGSRLEALALAVPSPARTHSARRCMHRRMHRTRFAVIGDTPDLYNHAV